MVLNLHSPARNAGDFSIPFSMDSIFLYIDVSGLEDGEILSEGGGMIHQYFPQGGFILARRPQ
jgi:hypothetical protein